eukprot:15472049-Alexandrium_andersonii.AAC.1
MDGFARLRAASLPDFLKCSGRNGVFLRVIPEHRALAEESTISWVAREAGEDLKVCYERALAEAGDNGLARRLNGGSCCFGVVEAAAGGRGRALRRI